MARKYKKWSVKEITEVFTSHVIHKTYNKKQYFQTFNKNKEYEFICWFSDREYSLSKFSEIHDSEISKQKIIDKEFTNWKENSKMEINNWIHEMNK